MTSARSPGFWAFLVILVVLYLLATVGIGLTQWVPDLLTVAVLIGARRLPGAGAALLGLVLGLLRDSAGVEHFGADALVLAIVGYLGARTRDVFEGDSLVFMALYLFLGKWLHDLGYLLVTQEEARGGMLTWLLTDRPIAALYTALAGLLLLILYRATARTH